MRPKFHMKGQVAWWLKLLKINTKVGYIPESVCVSDGSQVESRNFHQVPTKKKEKKMDLMVASLGMIKELTFKMSG